MWRSAVSADHHGDSHADDLAPATDDKTSDVVEGLTRVLAKACRQLGDAGRPREAGKLAADGWVLLRAGHPKQAERLDSTMHYVARLEAKFEQK